MKCKLSFYLRFPLIHVLFPGSTWPVLEFSLVQPCWCAFIQPSERMNEQAKRQADKQLGKESEGERERVWMKDLYEDCG